MTPLRQLVAQSFTPFERSAGAEDFGLATFDQAAPRALPALIGRSVGVDIRHGERILVGASHRLRAAGHDHRLALAITDRKLVMSGWSTLMGPAGRNGKSLYIDLHAIDGVVAKKAGLVADAHTAITTAGVTTKLTMPGVQDQVNGFLEALARTIPKHARCEPQTPFVTYGEEDPIGTQSALDGLWMDDFEARDMLSAVQANLALGMTHDVGVDLVNRVVMAHRARAVAPMKEGDRWLSPLSAADFGHSLVRLLGQPMAHQQPQPGVEQLEFRLDPRQDRLSHALAGLGVASFLALGIGFDPASMVVNMAMGRKPVTYVRAVFADQPGATGYQLFGHSGALEHDDAELATRLILGLNAAAYPVLAGRARKGWTAPYQDLLAS